MGKNQSRFVGYGHSHVASSDGAVLWLRRLVYAGRQITVSVPREVMESLNMYRGQLVALSICDGALCVRPLDADKISEADVKL